MTKIWRRDATKLGEAGTIPLSTSSSSTRLTASGLGDQALADSAVAAGPETAPSWCWRSAPISASRCPRTFQEIDARVYGDTKIVMAAHPKEGCARAPHMARAREICLNGAEASGGWVPCRC